MDHEQKRKLLLKVFVVIVFASVGFVLYPDLRTNRELSGHRFDVAMGLWLFFLISVIVLLIDYYRSFR